MNRTQQYLRSRAGTSITKASVRFACAMLPVTHCRWNKTGAGFSA